MIIKVEEDRLPGYCQQIPMNVVGQASFSRPAQSIDADHRPSMGMSLH
ncbi:hypothetical protein [Rossellomorea marisflavi]|nr:hypothetical protein [Rossellomorea marisflavi]